MEAKIREKMARVTGDTGWTDTGSTETAILLLEHKMAGRRLGFSALWDSLSKSDKIKDRISDGDNTELSFFSDIVFPIAEASIEENRGGLMSVLRERESPLLEAGILDVNKEDPLAIARAAEHAFRTVVLNDQASFRDVLEVIAEHNLLQIPVKLRSFVNFAEEDVPDENVIDAPLEQSGGAPDTMVSEPDVSEIAAWAEALETKFFQIRNYRNYIDEHSVFRTHQGVKGNEFERVMVVMDDDEAGGFSFSYEQYFNAKELSPTSKKKRDAGDETGLDRTRRLFYVTSTRAKNSLAHVIYTSNIAKVSANLIERKFAHEKEIISLAMED